MKSILEFIFSVAIIMAIYFGYQTLTGKNSVMSKPYDCDTKSAETGALALMFKGSGSGYEDAELFVKEFLPKLGDVATIKRSLIKLDSSSKSSVCGIDINYDLSANSLDKARKKFESYNYIYQNITNYPLKLIFDMDMLISSDSKSPKSFDEKFKSLDDYNKFLEKREASKNLMTMLGGMSSDKFYYKVFDNGKGGIMVQTSVILEDLQ